MTTIPPNPEEALVTISTPTSDTVRVRDRVESSRFELYFDDDVGISEATADGIYFPVDVTADCSGPWRTIHLPMSTGVCIHDHNSGDVIQRISKDSQGIELPHGDYEMEAMPAPVKIFLRIVGAPKVRIDNDQVIISTTSATDVKIGVRSPHVQPAGTITTTRSIQDVMDAVSHLGSALKTTSPERSWPTLRGYPPEIEVGSQFEVPANIQRPDVDVEIVIPTELSAVFQTAPLTYYTGASVVPATDGDAALIAGGREIPLHGNLSDAAANLLQKNFIIDSIVRSEGIYPFETHERKTVEADLPWDISEVYNYSLGERIAAYEEVPESVINSVQSKWPLTVDVSDTVDQIPAIPHLVEELAVVRTPTITDRGPKPQPSYVKEFIRADGGSSTESRTTSESVTQPDIITPEPWDTQIHVSIGDSYPIGSNSTSIRAFERHIERKSPATGAIEVHVVCNDDEMREEDVVSEFYGVRDLLEFEVNVHYNLTTDEFTALLTETFDLLHYIGHVDESGIKCKNGYVDSRTDLDEVGFEAFLLNACRSVEQAEALLDIGAIGGIGTLYDVPNSSATRMGRTLSRLLNRGFTIRSSLEIARTASYLGKRWVSIGDGRVSLTQAESAVPSLLSVTPKPEEYDIELEWFETDSHRIGTMVWPNTEWGENYVLPSSMSKTVNEDELDDIFSLEVLPVLANDTLYWTDEISPSDLRNA